MKIRMTTFNFNSTLTYECYCTLNDRKSILTPQINIFLPGCLEVGGEWNVEGAEIGEEGVE